MSTKEVSTQLVKLRAITAACYVHNTDVIVPMNLSSGFSFINLFRKGFSGESVKLAHFTSVTIPYDYVQSWDLEKSLRSFTKDYLDLVPLIKDKSLYQCHVHVTAWFAQGHRDLCPESLISIYYDERIWESKTHLDEIAQSLIQSVQGWKRNLPPNFN